MEEQALTWFLSNNKS
uniref:Uncharacterized protein n=1 Tax=Arundo donax TaxID=35708 RepID=A0A0A9CAY6_ARUDO